MITEFGQGKYYLYRHIRLDKKEVFYIGIGTKSKREGSYAYVRAKEIKRRNPHWINIINKTEHTIEVILESNDYEFVLQKEIEFIKLYGRKDLAEGSLANKDDGGKGSKNHIKSPEQIRKHKDKMLGKKHSIETLIKMKSNRVTRKVYEYDLNGNFIKEWISGAEAGEYYFNNRNNNNINYAANNAHRCGNSYWSYVKYETFKFKEKRKHSDETLEKIRKTTIKNSKNILVLNPINNTSVVWSSIIEFVDKNPNFNGGVISACCCNTKKSYKGLIFKYCTDNAKSN